MLSVLYVVEPSFSDGYRVRVELEQRPQNRVKLSKLKYQEGDTSQSIPPSRSDIPTSDLIISSEQLSEVEATVKSILIPASWTEQPAVFDGVLYRLSVDNGLPCLGLSWGDALPREWETASALVKILQAFARKKGLA